MGPVDRSVFPTALQQMLPLRVLAEQVLALTPGGSTALVGGLLRQGEARRPWDRK